VWEVWGLKAENFNLSPVTTTTITNSTMPTATELCQQIADMDRVLKETEAAEAEEAKKAAEAETARKVAETEEAKKAEEKKKADEVAAKRKADEAKAEKVKNTKKSTPKEADEARKAKVHALAASKKGKEVDKSPEAEVEVETETRQDCDSCARKELFCEWRVVSPVLVSFGHIPELTFE
jgi:phage I-like protein